MATLVFRILLFGHRLFVFGCWLGLVVLLSGSTLLAAPGPNALQSVPGADLFTNGPVHVIRVEMASEDVETLRKQTRKNVRVVVRLGKDVYSNVAVHLKGSGSFRPIDDKPSLTLTFDRFVPGQKFHGLSKIHLNNGVEDPTYLHEYIGNELFRAAGLPAPRVTHALVELNGRKLGLYVLKEGFTEEFLSLFFKKYPGNLYDIGAGHDVNEMMALDFGPGPNDQRDLKALGKASLEKAFGSRWAGLEATLDVERFLSFMAMEIMVGHRDGYCLARNNFRVYHDLDTDRFVFFPHGMDVLFGKPDNTYKPFMNGLLAKSIMETPKGQELYRKKFISLFTNAFLVARCHTLIDEKVAAIQPALSRKDARLLKTEAADLKERIAKRHAYLEKQLQQGDPRPVVFEEGQFSLKEWQKFDEPAGGKLELANAPGGRMALHIKAGPVTAASWRNRVILKQGHYQFEGMVSISGVAPLSFGKNQGAALRLVGRPRVGGVLVGDKGWQKVVVDFEVTRGQEEVEAICELRASKGEAWFDLESLRLVEINGPK